MKTAKTPFSIILSAVLLLSFTATAVQALTGGGATRGDAEAVFRAALTGGGTMVVHQPGASGAPLKFFDGSSDAVRISPFRDNAVYCAPGWHAVIAGWLENPADYPGGKSEALFIVAAVDVTLRLDGAPLEVERSQTTPVKGDWFGIDQTFFGVTFGAFLPPGSVAVGAHTLEMTTTIEGVEIFTDTAHFTFVTC